MRILSGILLVSLLQNPIQALSATPPGSHDLALAWDRSPSPEVTGYLVYYGPTSGNYTSNIPVGNLTTITVSGLEGGVTYFFAVTAFDASGLESVFSNEISLFTPEVPKVKINAATPGQFILTVAGLAGQTYDIEATEDFTTWRVIGTATLDSSGWLDFIDPDAAYFPQRFYRTQQKP